jgi:hypothetical protein
MYYSHFKKYSVVDWDGTLYCDVAKYLWNNYGLLVLKRIQTKLPPKPVIGIHFSQNTVLISTVNSTLVDSAFYDNNDPEFVCRMNSLKDTMVLMYSQNPVAFEELTQTVSLHETEFSEIMQTFYDGIINTVNGNYVLK